MASVCKVSKPNTLTENSLKIKSSGDESQSEISVEIEEGEKFDVAEKKVKLSEESKLTAAQKARIERNRLRARALQDARLVNRAPVAAVATVPTPTAALDSGGGFLLEPETSAQTPRFAQPPAAPAHAHERPACEICDKRYATSYLLNTFDCNVCDECRDEEGAHSLLTRTEAKTEFLLKDCDLDLRPPPLRSERRRNPHRGARSDMRLYLRCQVEARAIEVWGSPDALEEEKERRDEKRLKSRQVQASRRLRALRMDVRSSLFRRDTAAHTHQWAGEVHDPDEDVYSRTCTECGHTETYEKM